MKSHMPQVTYVEIPLVEVCQLFLSMMRTVNTVGSNSAFQSLAVNCSIQLLQAMPLCCGAFAMHSLQCLYYLVAINWYHNNNMLCSSLWGRSFCCAPQRRIYGGTIPYHTILWHCHEAWSIQERERNGNERIKKHMTFLSTKQLRGPRDSLSESGWREWRWHNATQKTKRPLLARLFFDQNNARRKGVK